MRRDKGGEAADRGANKKKSLLSYSLTAGAVLAVAAPAAGVIHYSGPQNLTVEGDVVVDVDMDMNGTPDFRIRGNVPDAEAGAKSATTVSYAKIDPYFSFNGILCTTFYGWAANLPTGSLVGPDAASWFIGKSGRMLNNAYGAGNFIDRKGYIGVQFYGPGGPKSGPLYYGWIQYEGKESSIDPSASRQIQTNKIIDWAYEDHEGEAIEAGDRGPLFIPTLNQWGVIILAALILAEGGRRFRKRGNKA